MTEATFRRIALDMPEATEGAHMAHPDFRVRGKIFATLLWIDEVTWGMVKLTPAQQSAFVKSHAKVFRPVKGAWGARGATLVCLKLAAAAAVKSAMAAAWMNTAPKRLVQEWEQAK